MSECVCELCIGACVLQPPQWTFATANGRCNAISYSLCCIYTQSHMCLHVCNILSATFYEKYHRNFSCDISTDVLLAFLNWFAGGFVYSLLRFELSCLLKFYSLELNAFILPATYSWQFYQSFMHAKPTRLLIKEVGFKIITNWLSRRHINCGKLLLCQLATSYCRHAFLKFVKIIE